MNDQQAQYPLTIDPSFTQQDYLVASITDNNDRFGHSVAISGDTLVVGAYLEDSESKGIYGDESNDSAKNSGAVYVFTRSDDFLWNKQAYIKASNTKSGDYFGYSVAISGDSLVVGAYKEDSKDTEGNGEGSNESGAAYVFTRSGSVWSQQAYLKASNIGGNDQFARSVSISGNTLVVGALNEDSNSIGVNGNGGNNSETLSGAAYVFTRSGTLWEQSAYLKASNTLNHAHFGNSVAIYDDTVVVGARNESSNSAEVNGDEDNNLAEDSGAAYVFTRTGLSWSQQAYLKASNTEEGDEFGYSVDISGDTLVVGAVFESGNSTGVNGDQNDNSLGDSGAAYVFNRSGSIWNQQTYLKASNTGSDDRFGYTVAIFDDTLIVGARYEDSTSTGVNGDESKNGERNSGAAYVFIRSDSSWSQHAYLKASTRGEIGLVTL